VRRQQIGVVIQILDGVALGPHPHAEVSSRDVAEEIFW